MSLSICVASYYCPEKTFDFFKELNKTYPVTIICHNPEKEEFLKGTGLDYSIIGNFGLEFHMYDNFIRWKYDWESNVIFCHDDIKFLPILKNNEIISPVQIFRTIETIFNKYDQAYVFNNEREARFNMFKHGRMICMSKNLCNWFRKKHIRFDSFNSGQIIPGSEINYNNGIEWFDQDLLKARQEGFKVKNIVYVSAIQHLYRNMVFDEFIDKYGHLFRHQF